MPSAFIGSMISCGKVAADQWPWITGATCSARNERTRLTIACSSGASVPSMS